MNSLTSTADGTLVTAALNATAPILTGAVPQDGDSLFNTGSQIPGAGPIAASADGNTIWVANEFTKPSGATGWGLWVITRSPSDYGQVVESFPVGGMPLPQRKFILSSTGSIIEGITAMTFDAADNSLLIVGTTLADTTDMQLFTVPAVYFTSIPLLKTASVTSTNDALTGISTLDAPTENISNLAYLGTTLYGTIHVNTEIPFDVLATIDPNAGTVTIAGGDEALDYTDYALGTSPPDVQNEGIGTHIVGLASTVGTGPFPASLIAINVAQEGEELIQVDLSDFSNSIMLTAPVLPGDAFSPFTENYTSVRPITNYAGFGLATDGSTGRIYGMSGSSLLVSGDELYSIADNATALTFTNEFGG